MSSFVLTLGFFPSERDFINSISKEDWKSIKTDAYKTGPNQCVGCGYVPENILELQTHIEDCIMGNKDSVAIRLLCSACHAIKHFDLAAEKGWVILVNSMYSQEELVQICRSGKNTLMGEIELNNIILLKNKNAVEYASDLKSGKQRHSDKIKVIFGRNFDWGSKNHKTPHSETEPQEEKAA